MCLKDETCFILFLMLTIIFMYIFVILDKTLVSPHILYSNLLLYYYIVMYNTIIRHLHYNFETLYLDKYLSAEDETCFICFGMTDRSPM